jgi:predicted flap endonuclease-1-like 5' DNA nuclease
MTELKDFLASLYDSFSEAEMQALLHGQSRLMEVLESGRLPEDVAVPVYHASDVAVTLDVGLVAEETEEGLEIFVTEAEADDASELAFTVELFELLEKDDLEDLDYDDVFKPGYGYPSGQRLRAGDESEISETDRVREGEPVRSGRRDEDDDRKTPAENGDAEPAAGRARPATPPIDVVDAIEPQYRERLKAGGIARLAELTDRSPEELADVVASDEVEVSPERAAEWLDEARGLSALLAEREADFPVELVDGIGPTFGNRLREAGIEDLSSLVELSADEIADVVSTEELTVSPERTATWLERSTATLRALEDLDDQESEAESASNSGDETD